MRRSSGIAIALTLVSSGCNCGASPTTPAVEAPAPQPEPESPQPQPEPEPEPPVPITCASATATITDADQARALTRLLEANPIEGEFGCPPALHVAQREPWHVPVVTLTTGEIDDLDGPTARLLLGERVSFWGIDPATGDMLLASIGRVDDDSYASARAQVDEALIERARELDPDFELPEAAAQLELGLVGEGRWRGLRREAISGARALILREWLASQPDLRTATRESLGLWEAGDPDELDEHPWILAIGRDAGLSVCVDAAGETRCWRCNAIELLDARADWATAEQLAPLLGEELADSVDDEVAIVSLRTHTGVEAWQLHLATGTWGFVEHERGRPSSFAAREWPPKWLHSPIERRVATTRPSSSGAAPTLVFEPEPAPALPEQLATTWLASPAPGLIVGGSYGATATVLAPELELVMQHVDGRWRAGHARGGSLAALLEWPDARALALVTGFEDYGNDGLGYASFDLELLTPDGEWLRPAGDLPVPLAAMAQYRHSGGWGYAYAIAARGACLRVELDHALRWAASGKRRRIALPLADLRGDWSLGPEGLVRGCP